MGGDQAPGPRRSTGRHGDPESATASRPAVPRRHAGGGRHKRRLHPRPRPSASSAWAARSPRAKAFWKPGPPANPASCTRRSASAWGRRERLPCFRRWHRLAPRLVHWRVFLRWDRSVKFSRRLPLPGSERHPPRPQSRNVSERRSGAEVEPHDLDKVRTWLEDAIPEGVWSSCPSATASASPAAPSSRRSSAEPSRSGSSQTRPPSNGSSPPSSSRSTRNGPQPTNPTSLGKPRMTDQRNSEFPDIRLRNRRFCPGFI